jgi:hypothetical protein
MKRLAERVGALRSQAILRKHLIVIATALAVALVALIPVPAQALWVVSDGTDSQLTLPSDPGWDNVTVSGSGRNFVYLGDGWALSARHVGPQASDPPPQTLQFSTGTFGLIPNQNFVVDNPSTMTLVGGRLPTDPVSSKPTYAPDPYETDLRLVRLNTDPGLPSIFDGTARFTLATQAPPVGSQITIIGHGPGRTSPDDIKRWGTNNVEDMNNYSNLFSPVLSPTTGVLALTTADTHVRDVASQVLQFDPGNANEAQAVMGDSGSGVFYQSGNNWYLAGIVNTAFTFPNQSPLTAQSGDLTSYADLSFYRNQILSVINAHHNYSINGDVNLDGVVSGDGTGPAATDDVTAFISGWGSSQATGNITSWKKGDLNLDGKVDVSDFLLLRSAYNSAGAGASLKALTSLVGSGQGGVPEPASAVLAASGATLLALFFRRRSTRAGR